MNKKYDEFSVVKSISKKHSVKVDTVNKIIKVLKDSTDVGNGTWGKIDYLCKVHGYMLNRISGDNSNIASNEDNNSKNYTKADKRKNKINMAAMTKNAMKKVKYNI